MSVPRPARRGFLATLSSRLRLGGAVIVFLVLAGAVVGYVSLSTISRDMQHRLAELRRSAEIGNELEALILNQITAGERYLVTPLRAVPAGVRRATAAARTSSAAATSELDRPPRGRGGSSSLQIERSHSRIEVEYALAHAHLDMGDERQVAHPARRRGPPAHGALPGADPAGQRPQADKVAAAAQLAWSAEPQRAAAARSSPPLAALAAIAAIFWVLMREIRARWTNCRRRAPAGRGRPAPAAGRAVAMASRSSRARRALHLMAGQLRNIVGETVGTAERISSFASDLSSISEEVAASSGEVATAMVGIARGAEKPVGRPAGHVERAGGDGPPLRSRSPTPRGWSAR
jgi:hypothetical protein